MKEYIGIKKVMAEPCGSSKGDGYKVIYPDGYESWSPGETFEEAYIENTPSNLSKLQDLLWSRVNEEL